MVSFADDGSVQVYFIDFGRALSLTSLGDQFSEKASVKEMQCRKMKKEKPWGVEQDWFGLCKTIYLLLVGQEMEKEHFREPEKGAKYERDCLPSLRSASNRTRQATTYKKKDTLWIPLFLTLLNYDSRENDYRVTVSELLQKMEKEVSDTDEAQLKTEIQNVKNILYPR